MMSRESVAIACKPEMSRLFFDEMAMELQMRKKSHQLRQFEF